MKEIEADVAIIGAGGAGLPAALTAVEKGAKKVILLEKRKVTGGNASPAGGIFACESPLQRQAMIDAPRDEIFKKALEWHRYSSRINPRILRAYINKSGDTIQWLMDKGIELEVGTIWRMHYHQIPCWHVGKVASLSGAGRFTHAMKTLEQKCKDGGVQLLLNTTGKKILRGANGNVTGVLAERKGQEFIIKATSVILSTGGFLGNKELLKKYFPFYEESFRSGAIPHTGDGVKMAAEAGAAIEDYATLVRETCVSGARSIMDASKEPYTVWVNKRGERFIDESTGMHLQTCSNALLRQPNKIAYALYDDKMVQNVLEKGFLITRSNEFRGSPFPDFREKLKAEAARQEWVKMSDTWDEIADWIGARPEALKAEIDEYNSYCDHGYDEIFAKERRFLVPLRNPPYYAIRYGIHIIDTIGPVRINQHMEVLDKQDNPISGLYAAGVVTSGWQSDDYCGDLLFASALGFSMNSGRIAGENATEYALKQKG